MKILLIEDNPGDARLVRELLKKAFTDFALDIANDLKSGLSMLASGGYEVALLDLGLPDSRGLESIARLRHDSPRLPVVILTAIDDEDLAVRSLKEGAEDYLIKGQVDRNAMRRTLLYAMERKRTEEALRASEERFRTLAQNLPDIVMRFDPQLRYVFVNLAAAAATGLPPEAFIGKTNEELERSPAPVAQSRATENPV